jgi:Ca-activated chloride channel family protein
MKKYLVWMILLATLIGTNVYAKKKPLDDWDQNATQKPEKKVTYRKNIVKKGMVKCGMGGNIAPVSPALPAPMSMDRRKIGFAVGGAKDTDNFEENIKRGYLPKLDAITYEGTFYQHYFDTALKGECRALFCPSYAQAVTQNLYTGEKYYYLSVGLNSGIDVADFKRKKLNLVVVIDISGSMKGGFAGYYYDGKSGNREHKSKMEIANESVAAMLDHLAPYDRLGVVLFDDQAYKVKPLRRVGSTDMQAIKRHILDLKPKGGTNWSAGYRAALDYFKRMRKRGYENRIIFITDAMPNRGELSKKGLLGLAKHAAKYNIHTTFIGVGVDFNTDLVEYVSKIRGANYYSVHSSKEFRQRLDKEFDYMVTPLVYDLKLKLASRGFKIDAVYGAPKANLATGEIMQVDTLFPSANDGKRVKGGVILLRLKKTGHSNTIRLEVSYRDTRGKRYRNRQLVHFDTRRGYDNSGIRKAILLSEYVTLMKNWIIDARAGCHDTLDYMRMPPVKIMSHCFVYPPLRPLFPKVKTWERRSCKLKVSPGYYRIFKRFRRHFIHEMKVLKDRSLNKELKVLNRLIQYGQSQDMKKKIDDWQSYFR